MTRTYKSIMMAEAAAQLDLEILSESKDTTILTPKRKKKPIFKRNPDRISAGLLIVGLLLTLGRWVLQFIQPLHPIFVLLLLPLMFIRREQVKSIYKLRANGIRVPYAWFYHRTIPYESIIRVVDDTISSEVTGTEHTAIRIILDTELMKYNITGMQPPNILLTTEDYDTHRLNMFADEVSRKTAEITTTPNTLAQRVEDQVNRAWKNRWKIILFNVFDSGSEFLIYILMVEAIIWGATGFSILWNVGLILWITYLIFVFIVQFFSKPQAIIALRPREIGGPLLYDEEEILSSVRFLVMCRPYTVHLRDCEIIYDQEATKQVSRLQQIQPTYVEPGEITYAVAQILGNHTKASGAKITFSYKEKEEKSDVIYQVPINWK